MKEAEFQMSFNDYYDNYLMQYAKIIKKHIHLKKITKEKAIFLNDVLLRWCDVWGEVC